jgi:hypothetical protein
MKSLYERKIKELQEQNIALLNTTKKLQHRIFWLIFILVIVILASIF